MDRHEQLMQRVGRELVNARGSFPNFNSRHEGYAIIEEEVDELWDAIKAKGSAREHIAREAVQVAAMAIRFVEDVLPDTIDRM